MKEPWDQNAPPGRLLDRRHPGNNFAGGETLDDVHDLRGAIRGHRLHEKMPMGGVCPALYTDDLVPFGDVQADLCEHCSNCRAHHDPSILRRTHNMVKQGRDVMPLMPRVAHKRDNNTATKAEARCEESDPRD
jgi:hypothetical protein